MRETILWAILGVAIIILLSHLFFRWVLGLRGRGWGWIGVCSYAAYILQGTGAFWLAVVVAMLNFWSFGIMHNFRHDPEMTPEGWTLVNMLTTVGGLALLVYGIIVGMESV